MGSLNDSNRQVNLFRGMARLIADIDLVRESGVLPWACPVPFFGRIVEARVATVGINPSNREFISNDGVELVGKDRRLPTLHSLSLESWSKADDGDIRVLTDACLAYFERNPYRRWFDVLDRLLMSSGFSYFAGRRAAHLDLVAYATTTKWGALSPASKSRLIARGRTRLAEVIRDSPVEVVVLNGQSVVDAFEQASQAELSRTPEPSWTLPRESGSGVAGIRYSGTLTALGEINLERPVRVIGFNHNVQSSFGVPKTVISRIAQAVGRTIAQVNAEAR